VDAMRKIRPDIVLGMADLVLDQKASLKRVEKMGDRTATWTQEMMTGIADVDESNPEAHQPALFAPILPVEKELQSLYLDQLQDEWESQVQGLVVYNPSSVSIVPESLSALPRASLDEPSNPEEVLRSVSLGVDILTIPFIGAATDAGTALDFEFPCRLVNQQEPPKSLGMDMWSAQYATDLSPLRGGCPCYTCSKHHRAYVQHLLSAKEMLGWVLLQIHNHQVLDDFFAGIRSSIGKGTYEKDTERFERVYERHWPEKTGHGPRYIFFRETFCTNADNQTESGVINSSPMGLANPERISQHTRISTVKQTSSRTCLCLIHLPVLVTWKRKGLRCRQIRAPATRLHEASNPLQ